MDWLAGLLECTWELAALLCWDVLGWLFGLLLGQSVIIVGESMVCMSCWFAAWLAGEDLTLAMCAGAWSVVVLLSSRYEVPGWLAGLELVWASVMIVGESLVWLSCWSHLGPACWCWVRLYVACQARCLVSWLGRLDCWLPCWDVPGCLAGLLIGRASVITVGEPLLWLSCWFAGCVGW